MKKPPGNEKPGGDGCMSALGGAWGGGTPKGSLFPLGQPPPWAGGLQQEGSRSWRLFHLGVDRCPLLKK